MSLFELPILPMSATTASGGCASGGCASGGCASGGSSTARPDQASETSRREFLKNATTLTLGAMSLTLAP